MRNPSITIGNWSWILLVGVSLSFGPLVAQEPPAQLESPEPGLPEPLVIVSGFLGLSDMQVEQFIGLRQAVEPRFQEIHLEIRMREERLSQEVESEDPEILLIEGLVLEIRSLREAAGHLQAEFVETLAEGLDDEQRGRLHLILQASHLQHVLPAFHAVGLIR